MFSSQICDCNCDSAKGAAFNHENLKTRLDCLRLWRPNADHQPRLAAFKVNLIGDVLSVSEFQSPKAYVNAMVQTQKVQNATHNWQFPSRTDLRTERDALPVDARVKESARDYAMLVEEPAEAPTEAAIEVVAEEPP